MPEPAALTGRTDFGMQFPQSQREPHMLGSGDVPTRVVTHLFDVDTLLETAPLGMLDSGVPRPNVLIVCSAPDIPLLTVRLQAVAVQPVHTCAVTASLQWPEMETGTLIVHDVSQLSVTQQISLYDWLARRGSSAQVIALTTRPLAPLVERGLFLQALHGRLNVLQAIARRQGEA